MEISIKARRRPESFLSPRSARVEGGLNDNDLFIASIPDDTMALYMSSQVDAFREAIRNRGPGPQGFRPNSVIFHLVLWDGRLVWVSSEDAVLQT